ncbi:MAG: adenosylcobyric acid synthase (glutamine-hydrolyzing) [Acidimicrobiaceae bacterium]|nr:adenosylcobyric acid synthase (glutamine-hydrolyzing) [Acidimicrobiaceae bacterium]
MRGAVLVCGTASHVGKSQLVAGLCRVLARKGTRVAPFKAQNMALNSFVTCSGHEIARSQAHQASAARVAPEVEMNPVLLKPSGELRSQVIVMGRPAGEMMASDYSQPREGLVKIVSSALADLRARYDVVVAEGAGGAAEINLLKSDLANLPLAQQASLPAVLVGDIERGGVFASLYGTWALLPKELRAPLRGFVINKFRGDASLLNSGIAELERRCRIPCLGVLPHLGDLIIDAEDSLDLDASRDHYSRCTLPDNDLLDIAVIRLPHLANFTDFDPLVFEAGVSLRYVVDARALADPDLIVLPGSKATVADLGWLRERGIDRAIVNALRRRSWLLGICAGYQMLGTMIDDGFESRAGEVHGLGLLESRTIFHPEKCTRQRSGLARSGEVVYGYQIHHGRPSPNDGHPSWFVLDEDAGCENEGVFEQTRGISATTLHGIFEADGLRRSILSAVADRRGKRFEASSSTFEERRQAEIDRVADSLEAHLDLDALDGIIAKGAPA